jgi:hypothetical protein
MVFSALALLLIVGKLFFQTAHNFM